MTEQHSGSEQPSEGAVKEPDGGPGSVSSPHGGDSSTSTGDENTSVQRSQPGQERPPAANQGDAEPVPSAPEDSPQSSGGMGGAGSDADDQATTATAAAGGSSRAPGEQGQPARPIEPDSATGAREMQDMPTPSALAGSGIPSPGTAKTATPGDSAGVAVPSVQAAAGTSEEHTEAQAVRVTSVAPPGQPDGQVDTRP